MKDRRIWVKEPRQSETFSVKKCYHLYRSSLQRGVSFLACCLIYSAMFCSRRRGPQVIVNFDMATEAGRAAALKASQSANGTADGAAGVLAELATVVEAGGADPDSGSVKESGWISSVSVGDGQR